MAQSAHRGGFNHFTIIKMNNQPNISIVIPAYNEGKRISNTITTTYNYLKEKHLSYEIIIVDDGSTDTTIEVLRDFQREIPNLKILRHKVNKGKGAAVKTGVYAANGEYILFMDADLATPIEELVKLWTNKNNFDVVIGSRYLKSDSIKTPQPIHRKIIARLGNLFIRTMLGLKINDTQCGFKMFRKVAAKDLFSRQSRTGWSFDIEILALAKTLDYSVKEVAVNWHDKAGSHVDPINDSIKVFKDVFKIRRSINSSIQQNLPYTQKA